MLGELNEMQILNLLTSQSIGRIGCMDGNRPYIVPVTYAFNGKEIICQSHEGAKLAMMRKNPVVCFQVDQILNMANWQSVLVTGLFHELKGKEAKTAREYLHNRVLPLMTSATVHPHEHEVSGKINNGSSHKSIMYSIRIKEKTGRFEKQ